MKNSKNVNYDSTTYKNNITKSECATAIKNEGKKFTAIHAFIICLQHKMPNINSQVIWYSLKPILLEIYVHDLKQSLGVHKQSDKYM